MLNSRFLANSFNGLTIDGSLCHRQNGRLAHNSLNKSKIDQAENCSKTNW